MSRQKALEILGLPETFARFEGQVKTLTTRKFRVYEVNDFTSGKQVIYYTIEKQPDQTSLFGMYPFNYLASAIYQMGFTVVSDDDNGALLHKPSQWVTHPTGSGLAGQRVYYVDTKIKATESGIDFAYEPFETTVNGVAEDMKDPLIRVAYHARTIVKGSDGKPRISWTSRYAINPKKRLRRNEFLKIAGMSLEQYMYETRQTWNIEKVSNQTHITSVAMDIETNPFNSDVKSVVYINGEDASGFNYQTLINSFNKTYSGFMWLWRLNNGPRSGGSTDNAYGSTLNVPINNENSTLKIVSGSKNEYNTETKTLTFNPDLEASASIIAYMEFLPAGGKNENCGKMLNLETGVESLF